MRVDVSCISTVVPFSDRIDATFEKEAAGGKCMQSDNSLNCNNHKRRLVNLCHNFTRGREGRLLWQQDTFCKTEWVLLNCKWIYFLTNNFTSVFQLLSFVACTKKNPTLLLYSFTCKCPHSDINSTDFTWCLNISSLLECKLCFEYWKILFPSESRWRCSQPNWIVDYAKKIGLCNIYWMHIKP